MNDRNTVWLVLLSIFSLLGTEPLEARERPNIVFILADDMGWPGVIEPGSVHHAPTTTADLLPTLSGVFLLDVEGEPSGCAQIAALAPAAAPARPAKFVASSPEPGFQLPPIVLQHDSAAKTGVDWAQVNHPRWFEATPPVMLGRAASYLREGLERMTGQRLPVVSQVDLSAGIVLVLLRNAPEDIRNDAEVQRALRAYRDDPYAANEAFFIRSEPKRILLVANTVDGLLDAVVELLESVGYEVLGMGPNWIHTPDYRQRPLVFALKRAGRPSYYLRWLHATSGQGYGNGTIISGLTDPADETVDVSNWRWQIGTRMVMQSMPPFPGHALQRFHPAVAQHMARTGVTEGILAPRTNVGPLAQRPAARPENNGWIWIRTNPPAQGGAGERYLSDGKTWLLLTPGQCGWNLDLSVAFVRQVVFEKMVKDAITAFEKSPDDPVIFGMDAEDGAPGNAMLVERMKHPNWYPQYRARQGLAFGRPYALHGFKGLNQPKERWDPAAASDHMFGFASWLLHEFDKWIDALPKDQQVTSTGKSKKDLIRCSFYSYNYHDVPPNFNPDPRIRVMIAGYPKHRGMGKWERFATHEDVAAAFKIMLPRKPSGDYRIMSMAYHRDEGPIGIPPARNGSPAHIAEDLRHAYDAGFRAMRVETDYNFGKYGLAYYLMMKMLWNANLTAADLDAIRDRWLRRAFGSAWRQMKAYYDFMLLDNYPVNAPRTWAQAIRLIDAADRKLDGANEPDAQRRIDDVKQYWYYHYLADSGKYTKDSPRFREYLWKGQMSYMVAMHMVARRDFDVNKRNGVRDAVGPRINSGPAHYTHAETQTWWPEVLDHWQVTPVTRFVQTSLSDGRPAKSVDRNDLVMVAEFQDTSHDAPFIYNSYLPVPFLMVAHQKGEPLGFRLTWPFKPNDRHYAARKLPYGVDIWNPAAKIWNPWIDRTMVTEQSREATDARGNKIQVVNVRLKAPRPGTYRFDIGPGGNLANLGSPAYDPSSGKYSGTVGFTYFTEATGFTQSPVYFYIPKATKSLDLEVWDHRNGKYIQLYRGLPVDSPTPSRRIDVSAMGTYTIDLEPDEDGTVASITGNLFAFPYFYSVPTFWAKSPTALLVPRGIAEADGLTIMQEATNERATQEGHDR